MAFYFAFCVALFVLATSSSALDETIAGPVSQLEFKTWYDLTSKWRTAERERIKFNDSFYNIPSLQWTKRSFMQPQLMVHDRYFYDPVLGKYTVDKYMADVTQRYGGIHSILLWQSYPNIGIDSRNQFEMLLSMPGGLPAIKQMVADFHRYGVKVFWPYNPWDQGTNPSNQSDAEMLAYLIHATGADGFNGDTMTGIPREFYDAATHDGGYPIVLEPEVGLPSEDLELNIMSWGYWSYDKVPCISKYKWLEPKHMVNVCDRWAKDKTLNLQWAFFNGVGYETWENIWAIWNPITEMHANAIRRVSSILFYFSSPTVGSLLSLAGWVPHAPTLKSGVYASKFFSSIDTDPALFTFINRNAANLTGGQIIIGCKSGRDRFFDVYHGVELSTSCVLDLVELKFDIEANGYGAIYRHPVARALPDGFDLFLSNMKQMSVRALSSYSNVWTPLYQHIVASPASPASSASSLLSLPRRNTPIKVPGTSKYKFEVKGLEIEGPEGWPVDCQYPWEKTPQRAHSQMLNISTFFMDQYPVTNEEYAQFLHDSAYQPKDKTRFLSHWITDAQGHFTYPSGFEKKPVVWVDMSDARAFCSAYGQRLPHDWEWQYAAQYPDNRLYPWGSTMDASRMPTPNKDRIMKPADDVNAHPTGASSLGFQDLIGNVYQWTDEFIDDHSRTAIIRGGSNYLPQGSMWYFPQNYKLNEHERLILMAPSMDRSAAISFRCVSDTL
eukprot:TRINITY_DN5950_c0_g1_i1.p1 TRINITY_DN5950_c0_g1~~TRINITY_DN5950_c0_g1_i1.p1  ORF type:complete len:734 (-),score=191.58 TRINITY_DN5950_c0_g1_i1:256-2427(-)